MEGEGCSLFFYSKTMKPFLQKLLGSPLTTEDALCMKVGNSVAAISKELLETQLICFNVNSVAVREH